MIDHELTLNNIKSELLTLYVNASEGYKSFNTYFHIFQESVFKFFDIKNIHFFIVQDRLLKPTNPSFNKELFRNGIEWAKFEYYFEETNIVSTPEPFINSEPFSQLQHLEAHSDKPRQRSSYYILHRSNELHYPQLYRLNP